MTDIFEFWAFVAGLGMFLFGMMQLEQSLDLLAGRNFRRFVRTHTSNTLESIFSGIFATVVLQSSSVVTLMVLAFVGAGIIGLHNAIGIVMGSNLGTTFTGWVVAVIGYRLDLDSLASPFVGLGALGLVFFERDGKPHQLARFVIGLGFLLFGLAYMKDSIDELANHVNLTDFARYGYFVFLLAGFVFTAIIQSSSATMMINLGALNAGMITLPSAAALAIGADLGTTITVLVAAVRGIGEKKRVAMAHFLFNLVTDLIAFVLMLPLLKLISDGFGISDPLFALVAFHSSFNVIGILIFLPFVHRFAGFLRRRFADSGGRLLRYCNADTLEFPEAAVVAMEKDIRDVIDSVFAISVSELGLQLSNPVGNRFDGDFNQAYRKLKQMEGELLLFQARFMERPLDPDLTVRTSELLEALRHAVFSAKALKDMRDDLQRFRQCSTDRAWQHLQTVLQDLTPLYSELLILREDREEPMSAETVGAITERLKQIDHASMKRLYREADDLDLGEVDLSTMLNAIREMRAVAQNLCAALWHYSVARRLACALPDADSGPIESARRN